MNENNKSLTLFAPLGLVWLLSLFTSVPPGGGLKPPATPSPVPGLVSPAERSFVRLWEDPLEATGALDYIPYKAKLQTVWTGGADAPPEESEPVIPPPADLAIFVPLRGLRYAEYCEQRRRQRYAVQVAFSSYGYIPDEPDRLNHLDVPFSKLYNWGKTVPAVSDGKAWKMRVPWEDFRLSENKVGIQADEFEKTKVPAARVRVFYINMNTVPRQPLAAMCRIARMQGLGEGVKLAVTSPPGSDWLRAMLYEQNDIPERAAQDGKLRPREFSGPDGRRLLNSLVLTAGTRPLFDVTLTTVMRELDRHPAIEIYNAEATAWLEPQFGDVRRGPLKSYEFRIGIDENESKLARLHEMVEQDPFAIARIQAELDARRAEIGQSSALWGGPNALIVVAESETSFARKFADRFQQTISNDPQVQSQSVLTFTYLRGLSGQVTPARPTSGPAELTGSAQRVAEARTPGEALSRAIEPPDLPSPYGTGQFDYVARLGESLLRLDRRRRSRGEGEIRAIGLIGTDIDDKLALLKVLRPRFSNALFFTNEVDADFLQPENIPWTRNLLVSTRYDLAGDVLKAENIVGQLPTFRGSAQVAMVDTIWAALRQDPKPPMRKALVYEVGLRQMHRLNGLVGIRPDDYQPRPKHERNATDPNWGPGSENLAPVGEVLVGTSVLSMARPVWFVFSLAAVASAVLALLRIRVLRPCEVWLYNAFNWARRFGELGLKALLGAVNPHFEAEKLVQLRKGLVPRLPELTLKRDGGEVAKWQWRLFSLLVALFGVGWACSVKHLGPLMMMVCSIFAIFWLRVHPSKRLQKSAWYLLGVAVLLMAVAGGARYVNRQILAEPVALADGVCVWPAIFLRLGATLLAIGFIRVAWRDLCAVRDELTQRFFLEKEGEFAIPTRLGSRAALPVPRNGQRRGLIPRDFPDHHDLNQGSNPDSPNKSHLAAHEAAEWDGYLKRSDPRADEVLRAWLRWSGAGLLIVAVAMTIAGFPAADARGATAKWGDMISQTLALVSLTVLCVFVCLQLFHARDFVRRIWGHGTTGFGLELEEAVLLVARLTGGAGDLIVYPFAICFILLCAHSAYLERWQGLGGLYLVLGLALGALIIWAWQMQRVARDVRQRTISYLQLSLAEAIWMKRLILQRIPEDSAVQRAHPRKSPRSWWRYTVQRLGRHLTLPEEPRILQALDALDAMGDEGRRAGETPLDDARKRDVAFQEARMARIDRVLKLVSEVREGAFGGWYENPIVRGILIPGVGLGSLELLQRVILG